MNTTIATSHSLLCTSNRFFGFKPSFSDSRTLEQKQRLVSSALDTKEWPSNFQITVKKISNMRNFVCHAAPQKPTTSTEELDDNVRKVLQVFLWTAEGVYILWLFLLPYAPVGTSISGYVFIFLQILIFV